MPGEHIKCQYCDKNLETYVWLLKPYHLRLCQKCTQKLSPVVFVENKEEMAELVKNDQKKSETTRNNSVVIPQEEKKCDDNLNSESPPNRIENYKPPKIYKCYSCEYTTTEITDLIEHDSQKHKVSTDHELDDEDIEEEEHSGLKSAKKFNLGNVILSFWGPIVSFIESRSPSRYKWRFCVYQVP